MGQGHSRKSQEQVGLLADARREAFVSAHQEHQFARSSQRALAEPLGKLLGVPFVAGRVQQNLIALLQTLKPTAPPPALSPRLASRNRPQRRAILDPKIDEMPDTRLVVRLQRP